MSSTSTRQPTTSRSWRQRVASINDLLQCMHGPTHCLAATMGLVGPFPHLIHPLTDAEVLDISVSADRLAAPNDDRAGSFRAQIRYATRTSFDGACAFHHNALATPIVVHNPHWASLSGTSDDGSSYQITIDDYERFRSVKVAVTYYNADVSELVNRFGEWHAGCAPTLGATASGVEITTFGNGRTPGVLSLLTSRYRFPDAAPTELRAKVHQELPLAGWKFREPRSGILFLDGPFDAETHLFEDDGVACVDFVGEFTMS